METHERLGIGRYLENYEITRQWPGGTMTEYANELCTLITGNPSSAHLDVVDVQASGHPQMLNNGGHLLARTHGMSAREVSSAAKAVCFLATGDVRILLPRTPATPSVPALGYSTPGFDFGRATELSILAASTGVSS